MSINNQSIRQIKLIKTRGAVEQMFSSLLGGDFRQVDYDTPHEYVQKYWDAYQNHSGNNSSLNGNIFELIIETLLYREGILPFIFKQKQPLSPMLFLMFCFMPRVNQYAYP